MSVIKNGAARYAFSSTKNRVSTWYVTISWLLEVYVCISQRPAGDDVTAHTDGHDGSSRRELLVEHCLRDI